jgi:8-oxo-dGTP diphosphatase
MTVKHIHVAVGVVKNADGQILLSKRGDHLHQGGLWEFPGGKVEANETVFTALVREFQEEVNLTIHEAQPLLKIHHDYGDKQVLLDVWLSTVFSGVASSNHNQQVEWVLPAELKNYDFPEANKAIINKLQS